MCTSCRPGRASWCLNEPCTATPIRCAKWAGACGAPPWGQRRKAGDELQADFGSVGRMPDPSPGANGDCQALIFTACRRHADPRHQSPPPRRGVSTSRRRRGCAPSRPRHKTCPFTSVPSCTGTASVCRLECCTERSSHPPEGGESEGRHRFGGGVVLQQVDREDHNADSEVQVAASCEP